LIINSVPHNKYGTQLIVNGTQPASRIFPRTVPHTIVTAYYHSLFICRHRLPIFEGQTELVSSFPHLAQPSAPRGKAEKQTDENKIIVKAVLRFC